MPTVKLSGYSAWAAVLPLTRLPVPEGDIDLHIDVRKKFRPYEKAHQQTAVENLPTLRLEFTDAELVYLQKVRGTYGEKVGWPSDLAEGARDLKRAIEAALQPPPVSVPKPTRQAKRLAEQKPERKETA